MPAPDIVAAMLKLATLALALMLPAAAQAGELFGGVYVHDVKTPLDESGIESGIDFVAGYRGGAIGASPLRPYAFAAVNSAGNTDYAAIGLSARFGKRFYVRPGLGIAIHNGSSAGIYRPDKIAFGARILFEPELEIGTQVNRRMSIAASWVHMSQAQLFSRENPGVDNIGVRLNLAL